MNGRWKLAAVVALKLVLFGRIASNPVRTCFPDVTYEDLANLNATCVSRDNCKDERLREDMDFYNCNCDSLCTQFDTCCVDSMYKTKKSTSSSQFKCIEVYGDGERNVFMVDSCKSSWQGDASVRELCTSKGEELDDPLLLVPVTNPETRITYRNYFCYVCNDDSGKGEPVFWNLKLKSKSDEVLSSSVPELHYNSTYKTWIIGNETRDVGVYSVSLTMVIPKSLDAIVYSCFQSVISDCAGNWFDLSIKRKCHAYMAVTRFSKKDGMVLYRNPHCAICNFENIAKMECFELKKMFSLDEFRRIFFVRIFSLHDKPDNMCKENMMYDSLAKKCRVVYKANRG